MNTHRTTRQWHRWLAGILGIQLTLWIVSGVYFSWVPIETVRGTDRRAEATPHQISINHDYIPVQQALKAYEKAHQVMPLRVELIVTDTAALYRLYNVEGHVTMQVNALTGITLPQLTAEDATAAAQRDYDATFVHEATHIFTKDPPADYRGPLPVYQVRVDDWRGTRIYVSPVDGHIISRRNHYWRVFDFFWMLHIMDFSEREDFNNPLLRIIATASLSIVITGYALLWYRRRRPKTPKIE